jgi:predicted deacylase
VDLPHRLVVAPHAGRFRPDPDVGDAVRSGDRIGWLDHAGTAVTVLSAWDGRFLGHLASEGERVRDAQPLACVTPGAW